MWVDGQSLRLLKLPVAWIVFRGKTEAAVGHVITIKVWMLGCFTFQVSRYILFLTTITLVVALEGFPGHQHPHQHVLDCFADLATAREEEKEMADLYRNCLLFHQLVHAWPQMDSSPGIVAPNYWLPF